MAEDLSSVVQAWVPRHHMCVLRHRMWAPCHRTPCRPTRPQGWDAPKKLRERWCHPLTCPLMRGERASLEASATPPQVPAQDLGYAAENARGLRAPGPRDPTVPLGSAECAVCVPLDSIEWHAPEAIREEGRPRTAARWPWATLKPWLSRPSRQAYALILQ